MSLRIVSKFQKGALKNKAREIFRKTYQRVRNVRFSENLACFVYYVFNGYLFVIYVYSPLKSSENHQFFDDFRGSRS